MLPWFTLCLVVLPKLSSFSLGKVNYLSKSPLLCLHSHSPEENNGNGYFIESSSDMLAPSEDEDDVAMTDDSDGNGSLRKAPSIPPIQKEMIDGDVSFLTGKAGVCRIEVARVEWLTTAPWQRSPQTKATGTGFVIKDNLLLTNAHVVQSAIDIRVRQHGSTRRFPARVAVYAPDVDLALLELTGSQEDQDEFFGSSPDLALYLSEELPALQESVHVVGFPTGGATICITEGVVSRIDLVSASAFNNLLAIQIDAAINPGNSGGMYRLEGEEDKRRLPTATVFLILLLLSLFLHHKQVLHSINMGE